MTPKPTRRKAPKRPSASGASGGARVASIDLRRIDVDDINPAPYNPRVALKPGDPDWERLSRSIDAFAYVDPLIWNETTGHLVGGHQRFAVLKSRGFTAVDVSVVRLDLAREKALNVALNRIRGRWDSDALALLLRDLADSDIDATLAGFDPDEIHAICEEGASLVEALVPKAQAIDDDPAPGDKEGAGGSRAPAWGVVITCTSAAQQRRVFERNHAAAEKGEVLRVMVDE
jgi:ParB-like chromosome segregation protein Spo0J